MKTKRFKAAALFLFLFVGAIAPTANCADKKAIQQQTNRAYYNLKSHGLAEFRCNVLFDWDGSFSSMKTDATWKETILPIAKQMKFQVSVGPTGAASVSHDLAKRRQVRPSPIGCARYPKASIKCLAVSLKRGPN